MSYSPASLLSALDILVRSKPVQHLATGLLIGASGAAFGLVGGMTDWWAFGVGMLCVSYWAVGQEQTDERAHRAVRHLMPVPWHGWSWRDLAEILVGGIVGAGLMVWLW